MFISVMFIATLIRFVSTSLVYENNVHRRKSMRAADEKLIINELGPNVRFVVLVHLPLEEFLGCMAMVEMPGL